MSQMPEMPEPCLYRRLQLLFGSLMEQLLVLLQLLAIATGVAASFFVLSRFSIKLPSDLADFTQEEILLTVITISLLLLAEIYKKTGRRRGEPFIVWLSRCFGEGFRWPTRLTPEFISEIKAVRRLFDWLKKVL